MRPDRRVWPERLPQLRNVHLDRLGGRLGRLAPGSGHEPVAADDLAGVEEELREDGALLRPAERERASVGTGLERPEDREFHAASSLQRYSRFTQDEHPRKRLLIANRLAFLFRALALLYRLGTAPLPRRCQVGQDDRTGRSRTEGEHQMDFRTNRTRQALAMLGACFGLLLLASPANARSDVQSQLAGEESSDAFSRYLANHRAHEEQVSADKQAYHATRTGIPDSVAAALEQQGAATVSEPLVVPYLSHGEGVIVGENGIPSRRRRSSPISATASASRQPTRPRRCAPSRTASSPSCTA